MYNITDVPREKLAKDGEKHAGDPWDATLQFSPGPVESVPPNTCKIIVMYIEYYKTRTTLAAVRRDYVIFTDNLDLVAPRWYDAMQYIAGIYKYARGYNVLYVML